MFPCFPGSKTIELTRLQTDIAYLATATNIPAGSYTSLTLTFANPMLTIENDTTAAIGSCAVGSICTMAPTTTANLATHHQPDVVFSRGQCQRGATGGR